MTIEYAYFSKKNKTTVQGSCVAQRPVGRTTIWYGVPVEWIPFHFLFCRQLTDYILHSRPEWCDREGLTTKRGCGKKKRKPLDIECPVPKVGIHMQDSINDAGWIAAQLPIGQPHPSITPVSMHIQKGDRLFRTIAWACLSFIVIPSSSLLFLCFFLNRWCNRRVLYCIQTFLMRLLRGRSPYWECIFCRFISCSWAAVDDDDPTECREDKRTVANSVTSQPLKWMKYYSVRIAHIEWGWSMIIIMIPCEVVTRPSRQGRWEGKSKGLPTVTDRN